MHTKMGTIVKLMEVLIEHPYYEWLMIDDSHCKVHPPCSGSERRQSGNEPHKRGLNTKLHLAVGAHGMPVRAFITQGTTTDCPQTCRLIEDVSAKQFLTDRGYDSDEIVSQAINQGMEPFKPPRRNRKHQRPDDKDLYKLRYLVENAFLHLKRWRGIAIRYAKNTVSFLAAIQIRVIGLWSKIS